jgi:hypothetical protein
MVTRLISSIIGLLAFAGMILAGCLADNPFTTTIQRSLVGLFVGMGAGYVVGLLAQHIIDEHFTNMVDADADAEIASGAILVAESSGQVDGEVDAGKANTSLDNSAGGAETRQDKESGQSSREQGSPSREQTLSMRAAKKMLG